MYWGNRFIAAYTGGQVYFQHTDVLGTVRAVTNNSGSTVGTFSSLPFGDGYTPSGTNVDPLHFSELDHDTSQTEHAQFRQYSSALGRWMSPDPYSGSYHWRNPQSLNRYTYALNNPLSLKDPSGKQVYDCFDYIGEDSDCIGEGGDVSSGGGGSTGCTNGGACIVDAGAGGSVTVTATPDPDPEPIGSGICLGNCGVSDPDPGTDPPQTQPTQTTTQNTPSAPGCKVVNGRTVCQSQLDNAANQNHPGAIHYRDGDPMCSLHVLDYPDGTEESHIDEYNPAYSFIGLVFHYFYDDRPDMYYRKHGVYPSSGAGRDNCK